MPLITRCAHCHTVFRITAEQLQAHGGQVRCGRCMQVFNGLATLSPDEVKTAVPAAASLAVPAEAAQTAVVSAPQPSLPAATPVPAGEVPGELTEVLPPPGDVGPVAEHTDPVPVKSLEPSAVVGPPAEENPFLRDEPESPPARPRRAFAVAAGLLLTTALFLQAGYFYRGELAARYVQTRPWLNAACERIGCSVELPHATKSLLIEASDLQSVDPARPDRIQLTATLRNHAGYDVAYPALDLVLTNVNDHTLARRIFLPDEYLGGGRDPQSGIAANAELTVRLDLETGNLGAAGFRLAVLPSPRR